MSARLIDPLRDGLWDGVQGHRYDSLFSSRPWLETVRRTYSLEIAASARLRQGRVEAAILFSHVRDLRGERVVCLPFSDYCDPLVEDAAAWAELVRPILALGAPVRLRCLRNPLPASDPRFAAAGEALWHGADLTPPEALLWAGLSGPARQNVRHAERQGVRVREGAGIEDVRLFHAMHRHVRRTKYRLLAQPLAFFENLHAAFAPDRRIVVLFAEVDQAPVAGTLFLRWGDTLYYKFNASTDQRLRPNDLLVWEGMRLGQRLGLARLDFGLSDADQPGLVRYKRKFATEERAIRLLRWQPAGHADRRGEEATATLHHITRLLTDPRVPDEVTRAGADVLYRFFC